MRYALLILLVGCGEIPPWHGDEAFTEEERGEIVRGIDYVSDRVGNHRVPIVWDHPHTEDPCPVGRICRRVEPFGGYAGFYKDHAITLVVGPGLDARSAHEFGHWYGLQHSQDPASCMHDPAPSTLDMSRSVP